jgi:predicted anti-sigma-YlaC factor YlaD
MSVTGADEPTCRNMRQLLGVYVVGAIDPAERSLVDEHLGQCQACRDELAGLAGLPAMLGRVPAAEAERIAAGGIGLPDAEELPPDMLNSLLRKVWQRRRARTWRVAAAAAAAVVIAAGSATAAVELSAPGFAVATAASQSTHVRAVVDYSAVPWGSAMRVQVTGIRPGTACQFWVLGKSGRVLAGSWTVHPSYGPLPWYSASATVAMGSVHGFQITAGGKSLVTIPAS